MLAAVLLGILFQFLTILFVALGELILATYKKDYDPGASSGSNIHDLQDLKKVSADILDESCKKTVAEGFLRSTFQADASSVLTTVAPLVVGILMGHPIAGVVVVAMSVAANLAFYVWALRKHRKP